MCFHLRKCTQYNFVFTLMGAGRDEDFPLAAWVNKLTKAARFLTDIFSQRKIKLNVSRHLVLRRFKANDFEVTGVLIILNSDLRKAFHHRSSERSKLFITFEGFLR